MNFQKLQKYLLIKMPINNINVDLIEFSKTYDKEKIENLKDFEEFESYYGLDKSNLIKFIYSNKDSIHHILYELEKIIEINIEQKEYGLSYYFYLCLLIEDNKNIINYICSFEYIKNINQRQKQNININKKIFMSKIILELINNYQGVDEKNENIIDIEKDNKEFIEKNIKYFKCF